MTSTALELNHYQPEPAAALAIQPGQITWDATQTAALAQIGLADASDGDRSVFLHVCQRTGLDPFARQIYMIARNEKKSEKRGGQWIDVWTKKWTIQTGIDGFRVNRARAERKAGVRGVLGRAIFYDQDGQEHKVWVQPRPPAACEITYTVKDRDGGETPYTSVLRFGEYCQTDTNGNAVAQWKTKPAHMLEKCTEADVYRKAFPQDFSGIYLDDAMPPDTPPDGGTPGGRPRGRVTAGEVLDRDDDAKTPPRTARRSAAGGSTRSQPAGTQAPRPAEENGADPVPAAAGDAPPRDAQHLPPLPGEDEPPDPTRPAPAAATSAGTGSSTAPAADGHSDSLEPGEAAEYGTERHRKLVGIVRAHFKRLGYTDDDDTQRLEHTARLAGVAEIGSTNDLDLGELSQVADTLARVKNVEALQALLNAGETDD